MIGGGWELLVVCSEKNIGVGNVPRAQPGRHFGELFFGGVDVVLRRQSVHSSTRQHSRRLTFKSLKLL